MFLKHLPISKLFQIDHMTPSYLTKKNLELEEIHSLPIFLPRLVFKEISTLVNDWKRNVYTLYYDDDPQSVEVRSFI